MLLELRVLPVLALVVGVPLGGEVVGLHQVLGEPHHAQGLGEVLDRVHGEGAGLLLLADLEVALALVVGDVGERAHRHVEVGFLSLENGAHDVVGHPVDRLDRDADVVDVCDESGLTDDDWAQHYKQRVKR